MVGSPALGGMAAASHGPRRMRLFAPAAALVLCTPSAKAQSFSPACDPAIATTSTISLFSDSIYLSDYAGTYQLEMVALSGTSSGAKVSGRLEITPSSRKPLWTSVDGTVRDSSRLSGSAILELAKIGALVGGQGYEGSPDTLQITLSFDLSRAPLLEFQRDSLTFNPLEMTELSLAGPAGPLVRGTWKSYGAYGDIASGFFCMNRLPKQSPQSQQ
jgi:hypothetical protein